jgi:hypothetical protein
MRTKGGNSIKCAGKSATPPDEIMISLLVVESQSVPPRGSGLLGAGDSRCVIVRGDWDTARTKFELLRNCVVMRTRGKFKAQMAFSAHQKTARASHQDSDMMTRRSERRTTGYHCIFNSLPTRPSYASGPLEPAGCLRVGAVTF